MELANDGANEQSQDSKTINFLIRFQMNQFKCKFIFAKYAYLNMYLSGIYRANRIRGWLTCSYWADKKKIGEKSLAGANATTSFSKKENHPCTRWLIRHDFILFFFQNESSKIYFRNHVLIRNFIFMVDSRFITSLIDTGICIKLNKIPSIKYPTYIILY